MTYPPIPSSLNAGNYELRDYDDRQPEEQRPAHSLPRYTPYLGLQARLSQSWINKWTVLLLLVLIRVLLAARNLNDNIASSKAQALSACTSVENVGSAMASMPHYMSTGVNVLAADGITSAVNALTSMLLMTITGVEEIVLFVINMLTSTYTCLLTMLINGVADVTVELLEGVVGVLNQTIVGVSHTIETGIEDFEGELTSFLGELGGVTNLFGGAKSPPAVNINASLDSLQNLQIPASFNTDIEKIRGILPNFTQVQDFTNGLIRLPFEEVKKLVNETLGNKYKFDRTLFPVAEKQALTFCSNNNSIASFFDGLAELTVLAKKIFIAVMLMLAVLACIPMAYRELWRYRTMVKRSREVQQHAVDPMDIIYLSSRPYTTTIGLKLASYVKSPKHQILVRWTVAYATSIPALFILVLGLAGLLSALCQYLLLRTIEKEVPALSAEVGDFAGTVVSALTNASTAWAIGANAVINNTNTQINHDVFGWVNTSTSAINNTLNSFIAEFQKDLNATFGDTILYKPIQSVLYCVVGLKVTSFQKGLTWVSDHAHITLPEFSPDVFSIGAAASLTNSTSDDDFLVTPGATTEDEVTGAVLKLTKVMAAGIREEFYIAACLCGIWLVIALVGVITACFGFLSKDKTRGEGGAVCNTTALPPPPPRPLTPPPPFEPRATNGHSSMGMVERRFPDFSGSSAYPRSAKSDPWGGIAEEEECHFEGELGQRMDVVGQGYVEQHGPGHVRTSSYGHIDKR